MKILITSGGTSEPIDGVRYITNFSTGRTGAELTEHFLRAGDDVVLIHAQRAQLPLQPSPHHAAAGPTQEGTLTLVPYISTADLDDNLRDQLSTTTFDAVIHLAAVSDYTPIAVETPDGRQVGNPGEAGKFRSDEPILMIRMRRNPKILDSIPRYAGDGLPVIIGFKLTNTSDISARYQAVQELVSRGVCDLVVHNDLTEIDQGPYAGRHLAAIYRRDGSLMGESCDRSGLHQLLRAAIQTIKEEKHDSLHRCR